MIHIEKFLLLKIGDQAPDFSARSVEDDDVTLKDHRGKVVLLDFWATWCAPCIAEMPNIKRMYDEHRKSGSFEVLGVSLDTDAMKVKRFVRGKVPWAQIVGGPAEVNPVAMKYFVVGVPATFLIDYEGKVVAKNLRGADLRREVRRQVKRAQAATPKVTAVLGGS